MIPSKLKNVPARPGVYLLKDRHNKILYVGKARILRNRLRSHFGAAKNEDPRHILLMKKVVDFETIVTDSEVEALILEANLIKEHYPKYNVNLKDDKSYPYIRVTDELYPRIFITRKIVRDGSRYFGPYTDVGSVRQLMAAVRRIFPVRSCRLKIDEESIRDKKHHVCLDYHIGRCDGPCEGLVSREAYLQTINQVVDFINGKNYHLISDLTNRMKSLAEQKRYEEASRIRDEIRSIEAFQSRQKVVDAIRVNRDIVSLAIEEEDACGVVFDVRDGKITNRHHFFMSGVEGLSESEVLTSFVKQYYHRTNSIPDEILFPFRLCDAETVRVWLDRKKNQHVRFGFPQKGEKAKLMEMCTQNARLLLNELLFQKSQIQDWIAPPVKALQRDLHLDRPPKRIEAFDISNISGSDAVGSLVVFENAKPKKSDYRKFKIRNVKGIDDFAMMAEVVRRRYSRLLKEGEIFPDLILVDGGKGQLSSALSVLKELEIADQPIIGLAKRLEEVFIPGISDAQTLPKSSSSLKLLQRIRDEAHRFAVTYHRQQRGKRMVKSLLDDVPGIGVKRRNALLKTFGSIDGIRKASVEDIVRVKGMNPKIAEKVIGALNKKDD
jgi:excinuclease ABC subunit C